MQVSIEEITSPKNKKISKAKQEKPSKKPSFKFTQGGGNTPMIQHLENEMMSKNKFTDDTPIELRRNVKPILLKALSIPAKGQAGILYAKLTTSQYINKYLDSYLYLDHLKLINDHAKFGLCYLFNFLEAKFYQPINIQTNNEQPNSNSDATNRPTNN